MVQLLLLTLRDKMKSLDFFMMKAEDISDVLNTDLQNGLSDFNLEKNKEKYGTNNLTVAQGKSFFNKVLEALAEPMTIILIFAALITIGINIYRF